MQFNNIPLMLIISNRLSVVKNRRTYINTFLFAINSTAFKFVACKIENN